VYKVGDFLDYLRMERPTDHAPSIPANIYFLGLTSLFTDISSEMVVSVLPIYLVGFLGLSPLQFGFVDGLYQGVAGVVQLASALVTYRLRRYKEMAAAGYLASAVCRLGLLFTTDWTGITAFLTLDRLGKGMRTAPRDALISLSVPRGRLGAAFGIHRAMDAMGAMLGPLAAFMILRTVPNGFDVVFVVSLCAAVVGLAVLGLCVQNRDPALDAAGAYPRVTAGAAIGLLAAPAFRHLAVAALLFGALTISDGFVYLVLQQRGNVSAGVFPLLYVLTSAGYLVVAVPLGRLADRVGRFWMFVAGHVPLLGLYGALAGLPAGPSLIVVTPLLLGLYYAATEGVLMAQGSALLPERLRTSGLAVLTTALAAARLCGSAAFGLGWTRFGLTRTVLGYLVGLGVALPIVIITRPRSAAP
jgi:hypothetical protein